MPTLVNEAVDVFDSFIEYASGLARLQAFRVQATARAIAIRMAVVATAGVLVLIGLVLLSVGVAGWLAELLGRSWAGSLLVGGAWILVAILAAAIGAKARFGAPRSTDEARHGKPSERERRDRREFTATR